MSTTTSPRCESTWIDWMDENFTEIFGCDENCGKTNGAPWANRENPVPRKNQLATLDYETMHDEFLEALLHEQLARREDESSTGSPAMISDDDSEEAAPRKRPRPSIRPRSFRKNRKKPESGTRSMSSSETVNTASGDHANPEIYLASDCRLQKDKGQGSKLGAEVCATGKSACLQKFRDKMRVLTDVAFSDSTATSASMKRRRAKISERAEQYIETRSMIQLRMGFLSIQYGVLIHWDTVHSGRAIFVVLRKNCPDSFFPAVSRIVKTRSQLDGTNKAIQQNIKSDHALLRQENGSQVTVMRPPYRVSRPDKFEPANLTISVLRAHGLKRKSNWAVTLKYNKLKTSILLAYNSDHECMMPVVGSVSLCYEYDDTNHEDLESVEIQLYEDANRRRLQRRLVGKLQLPLRNLQPQDRAQPQPTLVTLSCPHDPDAAIALELLLVSDYSIWMNKELEARRSVFSSLQSHFVKEEAESEGIQQSSSMWDWIFCVC